MSRAPTFQEDLLRKLRAIPSDRIDEAMLYFPELRELIDEIKPKDSTYVFVDQWDENDVRAVINIDTSEVSRVGREYWVLPEDIKRLVPSGSFKSMFRLRRKCLSFAAETSVRTALDMIFADVLETQKTDDDDDNGKHFISHGEPPLVAWNQSENNGLIDRFDYVLGYTDEYPEDTAMDAEQMLIVGSGQTCNGSALDVWPAIANMGSLHIMRKEMAAENKNSNGTYTYGFATNIARWQFFRIDNEDKAWASAEIDLDADSGLVWTWLGYIVRCARRSLAELAGEDDVGDVETVERFTRNRSSLFDLNDSGDDSDSSSENLTPRGFGKFM